MLRQFICFAFLCPTAIAAQTSLENTERPITADGREKPSSLSRKPDETPEQHLKRLQIEKLKEQARQARQQALREGKVTQKTDGSTVTETYEVLVKPEPVPRSQSSAEQPSDVEEGEAAARPSAMTRPAPTTSPNRSMAAKAAVGSLPDEASHGSADDRTDAIIILSLRESEQVRRTAHAVVYASMQDGLKGKLLEICQRTQKSMEVLSLPLMRKTVAREEEEPAVAEVLRQLASLQELTYQLIAAAKAVVESDDKGSAAMTFGELDGKIDELYRQTAAAIHGLTNQGVGGSRTKLASREARSPNARVFSDEQWVDVVAGLQNRGLLGGPNDARAYFGIFALLKSVFVDKGIPDPSISQVFGLAKRLSLPFGSMKPSAIETTLRQILDTAKEADVEVMSRHELLQLSE